MLCLSDDVPKKLRKAKETGADFPGRVSSANSCRSQFKSQPKTVMLPVSRCKAVCGHLADRVASVHLRGAKTRCWGVCARLLRGVIFTLETLEGSAKADIGRSGKSPGLPVRFPTLSAPNSAISRSGKMPRAGAVQRVRNYSSRLRSCQA